MKVFKISFLFGIILFLRKVHLWLIDLILSVGFKMQWTVERCSQFIFDCSGINFMLGIILWSIANFLLEFIQRMIVLVFLGFLILDRQKGEIASLSYL